MASISPKNNSGSLNNSRRVSDIRVRKSPSESRSLPISRPSHTKEPLAEESLDRVKETANDANIKDFFAPRAPAETKSFKSADQLKIRAWRPQSRVKSKIFIWGGGILGGLIGIAVILSTVFARAIIIIRPGTATFAIPATVLRVTPDARAIDLARGIIPGELIEFSETGQLGAATATGKKFIKENARGKIIISNAYSSQPQVLVTGTRFEGLEGKIFKLEKGLTVPGAKVNNGEIVPNVIEATVIAAEPGAEYNIGPTNFKLPGFKGTPKYQAFTAKSEADFQGGFNGEAAVATESDIAKASERVTSELYNFLKNALQAKIPEGFLVIEGARDIAITSVVPPPVGTPGEKFSVTAAGRVRALAFRPVDEGNFIAASFSTSTPYTLVPENSVINHSSINFDLNKRQLSLTLSGNAALGARVDYDKLKNDLAGKSKDEIKQKLDTSPGISSYELKFFPFWLTGAPRDPEGVRITIEPFTF
ncbi:MAG: hypothetical protein HYT39_00675 [Candidatus Sungbacteria bacterium]|nr:hypothetical protein [Candidatus Sungbacteria bacterium]